MNHNYHSTTQDLSIAMCVGYVFSIFEDALKYLVQKKNSKLMHICCEAL